MAHITPPLGGDDWFWTTAFSMLWRKGLFYFMYVLFYFFNSDHRFYLLITSSISHAVQEKNNTVQQRSSATQKGTTFGWRESYLPFVSRLLRELTP